MCVRLVKKAKHEGNGTPTVKNRNTAAAGNQESGILRALPEKSKDRKETPLTGHATIPLLLLDKSSGHRCDQGKDVQPRVAQEDRRDLFVARASFQEPTATMNSIYSAACDQGVAGVDRRTSQRKLYMGSTKHIHARNVRNRKGRKYPNFRVLSHGEGNPAPYRQQ